LPEAPLSIDVPPGVVMWFGNEVPATFLEPCPHTCHDNPSMELTTVLAWGPDLDHYEIRRCEWCYCRSWYSARTGTLVPVGWWVVK
jgi:hypothetical protein